MKILYAIQGTGNGHLCRAMDIVPCLKKRAEVDVLLSGTQADIELPFEVKYRMRGLSFIFGKTGGVDLWKTATQSRIRTFVQEINTLPVADYDLVISDFEPVSAWACYLINKDCIGLSHQSAALNKGAPLADEVDKMGKFFLENYAPCTVEYGFHFERYSENIYKPVIRQQIRQQHVTDNGHYTVYLPSYDDKQLLKHLSRFPEIRWEVFSKHNKKPLIKGNISIHPIHNEKFIVSMASSVGVLCGAGFETPAEALFLKKKLLVVPMKNQYEQHLNAAALKEIGIPVIKNLKPKHDVVIQSWLDDKQSIEVCYEDDIQEIVDHILENHKKKENDECLA